MLPGGSEKNFSILHHHHTHPSLRRLEAQVGELLQVMKWEPSQAVRQPDGNYRFRFGLMQFVLDGKRYQPGPGNPALLAELTLKAGPYATLTVDTGGHRLYQPHPFIAVGPSGEHNKLVVVRFQGLMERARSEPAFSVGKALMTLLLEFNDNPLQLVTVHPPTFPQPQPKLQPQPPFPAVHVPPVPAVHVPPVPAIKPPAAPASWPELERLPLISLQELVSKPKLCEAFVCSQVGSLRDFLEREQQELAAVEDATRRAEEASKAAAEAMRRVGAAEAEAERAVAAAAEVHREVQAIANKFSVGALKLQLNSEIAALEVESRAKREALLAPAAALGEAEVGEFLELRRRLHKAKLLNKFASA